MYRDIVSITLLLAVLDLDVACGSTEITGPRDPTRPIFVTLTHKMGFLDVTAVITVPATTSFGHSGECRGKK